jgi:hypothetical protein
MAFDLAVWRAETQQIITDFAHDPRAALAGAGTNTFYGMLLGSTILPVVAAYASDPKGALAVLFGVAGGLGGNLVANLVQQKYDTANALAVATQEAQEAALAPLYQKLAEELQVIPLAEQALADAGQTAVLEQLRAELQRLGTAGRTHNQTISGNAQVGVAVSGDVHGGITHTQQSGGVNFGSGNTIEKMGDVIAGDKVAGDKVLGDKIMHYGAPKLADTGPEHIHHLIDQHTRRLRVLETQAAATGYNVRPEVQNERSRIFRSRSHDYRRCSIHKRAVISSGTFISESYAHAATPSALFCSSGTKAHNETARWHSAGRCVPLDGAVEDAVMVNRG